MSIAGDAQEFERAIHEMDGATIAERLAFFARIDAEFRRRVLVCLRFNVGARPSELEAVVDHIAETAGRRLATIPQERLS